VSMAGGGVSDRFSGRSCKIFFGSQKEALREVLRLAEMLGRDTPQSHFRTSYSSAPERLLTPLRPLSIHFRKPSTGQTSHNMDYRAVIASGNVGSFNNFNTTITDDRNQVLQWLSPLEPQRRHQHIRESRLKGTGNWIFQTSEFRRWETTKDGSSHSVLFCHGDPGVGKTHLR